MNARRKLALAVAGIIVAATAARAPAHPGSGIVLDAQGRVYFTDTGEGLWKIDGERNLSRVPGSAFHWMAIDEQGRFANSPDAFGRWFERASPRGSKPTIVLCSDFPCAIGKDGNLYFANTAPFFSDNPRPTEIVRRTPEGNETMATDGTRIQQTTDGNELSLGHVTGLAAASDGSIYIMQSPPESDAHAILKLSNDGALSEFASRFLNRTDGIELEPGVSKTYCRGLAVGSQGEVYVAVTGGRRVVKVSPQGAATTVLQADKPWSPTGVALLSDEVYVLEYTDFPPGWNPEDRRGWVPRVRKVGRDGQVATLATVVRALVE
jgi:sugar lactone lactonase YvrE